MIIQSEKIYIFKYLGLVRKNATVICLHTYKQDVLLIVWASSLKAKQKHFLRGLVQVKPKPKLPTAEQLKRMEVSSATKPGLMEYAHNVGSFAIEKLNVEEMKNTALLAMHQQTEMQLDQIYEQVELLAKQAQKIKARSDISRRIYKAKMGFKPKVGSDYYLYRESNGKEVLSMISPDEWGLPHEREFIAQVTLLADQTWDIQRMNKKQDDA